MTDDQIIECAKKFRDGILDGRPSEMMCFAVCAPLSGLLGYYGIENHLVEGEVGRNANCNHFWIELNDGRVLDPTADQFNGLGYEGMPPVYLGSPTDLHIPLATAPDEE